MFAVHATYAVSGSGKRAAAGRYPRATTTAYFTGTTAASNQNTIHETSQSNTRQTAIIAWSGCQRTSHVRQSLQSSTQDTGDSWIDQGQTEKTTKI